MQRACACTILDCVLLYYGVSIVECDNKNNSTYNNIAIATQCVKESVFARHVYTYVLIHLSPLMIIRRNLNLPIVSPNNLNNNHT
jgi:hypothetical protein